MSNIVKLSELNDAQLDQAVDVFIEGFYNTLRNVSKDKKQIHKLFKNAFDSDMTYAFLQDGNAVGFLGLADCHKRPIKLNEDTFNEVFGNKGNKYYKAVSAEMEKILAQDQDEIWIDYIATNPEYRSQGIGKKFIDFICENLDYNYIRLMVLSKNPRAIAFYERAGFKQESVKTNLLVVLAGYGKEITMRKDYEASV